MRLLIMMFGTCSNLWVGVITDASKMQGTLEEAIEADLLLHVIDGASPDVANQRDTVYHVLRELGMTDAQLRSRVIEVWNKADLLEESSAPRLAAPPLDDVTTNQAATSSLHESDDSDAEWEPSLEAEGALDANMLGQEDHPFPDGAGDEWAVNGLSERAACLGCSSRHSSGGQRSVGSCA